MTTVSESPALFFRVDMPGHIKHKDAMGFDHVYLSYNDPPVLPSTEFSLDFPPDALFSVPATGEKPLPKRFIRAYQVDLGPGKDEGPWLAGMTLNPADVYQAWCHERGYVCLIEELGGRPTKPGDTFGACYLVGWFDDIDDMEKAYDRYRATPGSRSATGRGDSSNRSVLPRRTPAQTVANPAARRPCVAETLSRPRSRGRLPGSGALLSARRPAADLRGCTPLGSSRARKGRPTGKTVNFGTPRRRCSGRAVAGELQNYQAAVVTAAACMEEGYGCRHRESEGGDPRGDQG